LKQHSEQALKKANLKQVEVDAVVVSVISNDELAKLWRKDDGQAYSRQELTRGHVLFQEQSEDYDYIDLIFSD